MTMEDIIIDNGAYSIKVVIGTSRTAVVRTYPNCIARSKEERKVYVGPELRDQLNLATIHFRRPFEKGYLVNWETQNVIWRRMFAADMLDLDPKGRRLIITEPAFNFTTLRSNTDEMLLDEYKFSSAWTVKVAALIPWGDMPLLRHPSAPRCYPIVLVIDSGFSFTNIIPVIDGNIVQKHIRRIDVGGKLLTNVLKETISYRYYNMMEEGYLINEIKEKCCFVSLDFNRDLELAKQGRLSKTYVLPDFSKNQAGYVADDTTEITEDMQVLRLTNELFSVPELLFNPSDIEIAQAGVVEACVQVLTGLPKNVQSLLCANVVLIGGSTKFQGFAERFERDLRTMVPDQFKVRVYQPSNPITYAVECGQQMLQHAEGDTIGYTGKAQHGLVGRKASLKAGVKIGAEQTSTPGSNMPVQSQSKYVDSERSDTPRSFSPDTEPEMAVEKPKDE